MMLGCFFLAWMGQFAHMLRDKMDWRIIALARSSLALVIAVGLAKATGAQLVLWRPGALWVRGFASSISLLCTFYGFHQLQTSEVLTLTNTFPIWVAFLSWPMLHVRPTLSVWLAAAFGVAGVALMQLPHFHANEPATATGDHTAVALALCMVAALTNAIAMLGLNRLKGISSWAIVVHYSGVATVFVLASWAVGPFPDLTPLDQPKALTLLVSVGLAATMGQVCITRAFTASEHPERVSVVGLTQVVFALALDLILGGLTSVEPVTIAGICLVLAPTAWMMAGQAKTS